MSAKKILSVCAVIIALSGLVMFFVDSSEGMRVGGIALAICGILLNFVATAVGAVEQKQKNDVESSQNENKEVSPKKQICPKCDAEIDVNLTKCPYCKVNFKK